MVASIVGTLIYIASEPPQSMKSLQNAIATMASIAISIYKCFHLRDKGEDSFKSYNAINGLPLSIHVHSVILYMKPFQCHTRYKSRGNDADAFGERETTMWGGNNRSL
jgi:hypothetical protein